MLYIFSGRHSCTEDKSIRDKWRSEFDKTENPSKYLVAAKEIYNQTSSQEKVRYKMKTYELFTFWEKSNKTIWFLIKLHCCHSMTVWENTWSKSTAVKFYLFPSLFRASAAPVISTESHESHHLHILHMCRRFESLLLFSKYCLYELYLHRN